MHWTSLIPRKGRLPLPTQPALSDAPPVILLHGTLGSPGNFSRTAHALQQAGRRVIGLEYNHRGTGSLADSVAEVGEYLERFDRFDLVGHSMGGLVGLELAHAVGARMSTLVGVAACWRGVPNRGIARLSPLLGKGYQDALRAREPRLPAHTRVVSVISDADRTVPAHSARLGDVIVVHGVHHAHMANQAEAILRALR
ncbi:alpha/beta hydrolase [Staphylococcus chromogenes]|nr:alpha/beta hydrolase [Staphylococcus chromogenes]